MFFASHFVILFLTCPEATFCPLGLQETHAQFWSVKLFCLIRYCHFSFFVYFCGVVPKHLTKLAPDNCEMFQVANNNIMVGLDTF